MMKTRTISIFTAVLLCFALMFILTASAMRTWTATFDGDITGTAALTFKKGYWLDTPTTYTFDPVSDPDIWIGNEASGYTDFAGPHTGHVQIYGPSNLEAVMNMRWTDTVDGVSGQCMLVVRVIYDFSQSPGNLVLTSSTEADHYNMWFYPDAGGSFVVWSGLPIFTLTIPLAPD